MADDMSPDQTPVKNKSGKPWGYLVFAVLILGVFLTMVLKPDLPRSLFGNAEPRPEGLGDSPAAAGNVSGAALGERNMEAAMSDLGTIRTAQPPLTSVKRSQGGPAKPVAAATTTADDPRAAQILAEAETAYQAMDWDKADSAARRIAGLAAKPATLDRAADIARGALALKRVFKELDERDELSRNFETHPALIRLIKGGSETLGVPITQMTAPFNPVTENPVAWIEAQRKIGKVMILVKGAKSFTPAEMDVADYDLQPADLAGARAAAQQALSSRVSRIEVDKSVRRDAFVWYELGKFAYRNRLDDQVVRHLGKAIDLDPDLAKSVREANAGMLFGSLVMHSKNGNKQQAASFMASIERRYKDTDQAKQARLFYDGKQGEMVAAAKEAERRQSEEAAARLATKVAAAQKQGNEEKAKAIVAEAAEVEEEPVATGLPVNASVANARKLRDQGRSILSEATNMPPTEARNHKYAEAAKLLATAKGLFAKWLEKNPGDSSAEAEMIESQKMWFLANKSKTL